jgi:flagellar basal-body rod protein FlgG
MSITLGLGAAVSGMAYHQTVLDVVSQNLSNAGTLAFRRSRLIAEGNPLNAVAPEQNRLGVAETTVDRVFTIGAAQLSESPLHFAINDDSFFRVRDFDGTTVLTRFGALTVGLGGRLAAFGGRLLEPPIQIPIGQDGLAIDAEGIVTGIDSNSEKQTYGQITLVRVMNPAGLVALGDGLYRETVNSGAATEGVPGSPGFETIINGALEASNTDAAQEFTQIIVAQRAYQAAARTFGVGDEMLKLATNLTQ